MIAKRFLGGSLASALVEVLLIVIGILIALSVDEWRHDIEEKNSLRLYLTNLIIEIDDNRWTLYNIRDRAIPQVMSELGTVIQVLGQSNPKIENPERFIRTLLNSSSDPWPWFTRNVFDSLKSSDEYRSQYIQDLANEISSTYEAPNVLFERRFDHTSAYEYTVNALVPARFQAELNGMRGYTGDKYLAPLINDEQPLDAAMVVLLEDKDQIVRLARQQSSLLTAKWYAITRTIWQFEDLREKIIDHPLLTGVEIPENEGSEFLKTRNL